MNDNIYTSTLPSGMRFIVQRARTAGVYLGVAVACGTRDEKPQESGMAHFTEHMTFKGTARRSAMQIISRLEGVGGELNAYTGKEETVYYAAVEPCHLRRAVDLLLDIVFDSVYPQAEMEKEVEVVCDEIESYNDNPSELIFDDFEALVFGQQNPLGRNILGDARMLRQHTHYGMAAFARRGYRADNACFFVYGDVDALKVERMVRSVEVALPHRAKAACQGEPPALPEAEPPISATDSVEDRGSHQAHFMLGTRTVGMKHPDRLALQLLNNILGGPGLNSRLNLSLRERHGLVYTVESNYTGYTDTGVWSIYLGCDHDDVRRCRRLAMHELDRLCQSPLRPLVLAAAKRQMLGQLALGYDQHEGVALGMGKAFLHYGTYKTKEQITSELEALTADKLHEVACKTFNPNRMITLLYR